MHKKPLTPSKSYIGNTWDVSLRATHSKIMYPAGRGCASTTLGRRYLPVESQGTHEVWKVTARHGKDGVRKLGG